MVNRKTVIQRVPVQQTAKIAPGQVNQREIEVVQARLQASDVLSLADENDSGTDPYNSTGQYAALGTLKKK